MEASGAPPRKAPLAEGVHGYGIDAWGQGYFTVNSKGHLAVTPYGRDGPQIDVMDVVEDIAEKGLGFPCIVRFQDILRDRVVRVNESFRRSIQFNGYKGGYFGVFPLKVNPMREVVEEVIDAGAPFHYGLEAGTKPELVIALALNSDPQALTICNGYKDESYMHLALMGRRLGRKTIVVIEKLAELPLLLRIAAETGVEPHIGIRAKLTTKGVGKWESSGGEFAKFGLTIPEVVAAARMLQEHGLSHCLKLFHFHLGSQVTDIRVVKEAVQEGARIYCDLWNMGMKLEYFDIGGGLAVDYDGSRSTSDSSANYTLEEYASDVVYNLMRICDEENVPHPNVVSESGRGVTAHHSCVLMNVLDAIEVGSAWKQEDISKELQESHLVAEIREVLDGLNKKNVGEAFHDAQAKREEAMVAFRLGVIGLEERGAIESMYWQVLHRIVALTAEMKRVPKDIAELKTLLTDQYISNFSLFQSAIDHWAFKQVFPVVPLQRLDEQPQRSATIVDITCDSDGKIERFADPDGPKPTLPVHALRDGEPYYLGIFLTGAYQDIMGDLHNLFGRTNEVHIFVDDEDPEDFYIETVMKGDVVAEVLDRVQYEPRDLLTRLKTAIDSNVKEGRIKPKDGVGMVEFLEAQLRGYTYLSSRPAPAAVAAPVAPNGVPRAGPSTPP